MERGKGLMQVSMVIVIEFLSGLGEMKQILALRYKDILTFSRSLWEAKNQFNLPSHNHAHFFAKSISNSLTRQHQQNFQDANLYVTRFQQTHDRELDINRKFRNLRKIYQNLDKNLTGTFTGNFKGFFQTPIPQD